MHNWEAGHTRPALRYIPKIIDFLGYVTKNEPRGSLHLPDRLKAFRRIHGLSQERLAVILGVDESAVWQWEQRCTRRFSKLSSSKSGLRPSTCTAANSSPVSSCLKMPTSNIGSKPRARLTGLYCTALEEASETAAAAGDGRRVLTYCQRLIEQDPYNSRYAIRLMEALLAAGDPANALLHAERHEQLLNEELGVAPPA